MKALTGASAYELAIAAPFAVAAVAVSLEVAWLARRDRSVMRRARTALAMALGGLIFGVLYAAALRALWTPLFAMSPLRAFWRANPLASATAAFLAWDAMGWLYHWVGHRTPIGWASHQPHHSAHTFDITAGLRQSWTSFHGLAYQPLLAVAGFSFPTIAVCAALSNCWQLLNHSAAPVPWPRRLSAIVMTPAAHRVHHAIASDGSNLGAVLTMWDRVAGTWIAPASCPDEYGSVPDGAAVQVQLAGWFELGGRRAPVL